MNQYRISFVGAGRVSGSLCHNFYNTGYIIREIASKSGENNHRLADLYNAKPSDLKFTDPADVIIVAVPDDALEDVLKNLSFSGDILVAHTAGSLGLEVFPPHIKHRGVFYPLQTFSDDRPHDLRNVPFFLEASDDHSLKILKILAESIGGLVQLADTERRKLLHTAAVFVCNFTNHMMTAGKEVALRAGFPFGILRPLIIETVEKSFEKGPEASQTGPAIRLDRGTIRKHTDLLSFSPELRKLYVEITDSIIRYHKKEKHE